MSTTIYQFDYAIDQKVRMLATGQVGTIERIIVQATGIFYEILTRDEIGMVYLPVKANEIEGA